MLTDNAVRRAAAQIYGDKNVIVKRNGEVHVRGIMPNSNEYGWYLLGFTGQHELEDKLFNPYGSLIS